MKHIYISSCDEMGGILHYTLSDGKLEFKQKTDLDRPMYMVIDKRKAYIALRETDKSSHFGAVVTADIDENGRLCNLSEPVSSRGVVPCHLCVNNGTVYTVNYLSGNIVKLPDRVVTHSGHGSNPKRQEAPHTHFVTVAADGYILCCDLGLDTVFTYDRELNPISSAKVFDGHGARHLEFSEDGRFCYCVNEMGNTVTTFGYSKGVLTLKDTVEILPGFTGQSTAAAIRRVENSIFVSNRGADCVSRLAILCDGTLKPIENTPCGGMSPRDIFAVDGRLFCANELTDDVTVIDISGETPILSEERISVKHPLCICMAEI